MIKKLFNITILLKIYFFNKSIFKRNKLSNTDNQILCEFTNNSSNQIAFSYLVNFLINDFDCKCVSYQNIIGYSFYQKIKIFIQRFIGSNNFFIFKSFNIKEFIFINKKNNKSKNIQKLIDKNFKRIKKKEDLLKFKFKNVVIGDLIYDAFLKDYSAPTIDLKDRRLKKLIEEAIYILVFWLDYFNKYKVLAVVISDTVFLNAILARVAVKNSIKTYSCNWDNIHLVDKNNLYAYAKSKHYRNDFKKLNNFQKKIGLKLANNRIRKYLKGNFGMDSMIYASKSSFKNDFKKYKVLNKNKKKKILIAAHDFSDAPHFFGPDSIIFVDFYEWLLFLYKISKKTNYEWYLKIHPHSLKNQERLLKEFLKDKKNFIVIPKETSNLQIIKEGINCVTTIHGTVAWEYAYYKIPVISASKGNLFRSYNFNIHANNKKQYKNMILNYDKFKIDYNKNKIREFYFMHNLFSRSNWLVDDINKILKKIKGYDNLTELTFYNYWIKEFKRNKLQSINKALRKYIYNKETYIKNYNHFN